MIYLKFEIAEQASAAEARIASNMGLPDKHTERWAIPDPRFNYFPKPEEKYMTGVVNYTETDFLDEWKDGAI